MHGSAYNCDVVNFLTQVSLVSFYRVIAIFSHCKPMRSLYKIYMCIAGESIRDDSKQRESEKLLPTGAYFDQDLTISNDLCHT